MSNHDYSERHFVPARERGERRGQWRDHLLPPEGLSKLGSLRGRSDRSGALVGKTDADVNLAFPYQCLNAQRELVTVRSDPPPRSSKTAATEYTSPDG